MAKPTLPQGTRDFSPDVVRRRNYILSAIRSVFELYGFQPLETPAMENLETLMGKYGDEGDKLIFRILNNGLNDPKNIDKSRAAFENTLAGRYDRNLTERALRYDLTIPFARYVAMNHGQITFPFRRYQVQPVWRADRPQKGRYREFYQCDADVVGSHSLLHEIEFAIIYHQVFTRLGISGYSLRINSRKLLAALAEKCGGAGNLNAITVAIDKLDKIGLDKVKEELLSRNLSADQVKVITAYLSIEGPAADKLKQVSLILQGIDDADKGIAELSYVLDHVNKLEPSVAIEIDFTLARGLNYYTGIIFEAKAPAHISMGSIGGGGRYDDLTGLFGVPGIPGVGISFGVDRIYDVMEEMDLFPGELAVSTKIIFLNTGQEAADMAFQWVHQIRQKEISAELFPDQVKIDKQFRYAERKAIPYVATIQTDTRLVRIKDIRSGEWKEVKYEEVIDHVQALA